MYMSPYFAKARPTMLKHLSSDTYVSPVLLKILEICKLHVIPYEKLHKECNFCWAVSIPYLVM